MKFNQPALDLDRRRFLALAGGVTLTGATSAPVWANTFPSRPIRLVVTLAAGGSVDATARAVAELMARKLGKPVIVENKVGGRSAIGASEVARSAADGHTLLFGSDSSLVLTPLLVRKPSYDPVRDFVAIGEVLREPMVLAVRADLPVKTVADLLAYARANPGKLNYSSSGLGGLYHLAMELLCQETKIQMVHVPYLGGGPALLAALGGQVDVIFNVASAQLPHIKSGKLRALAVLNAERLKRLPELPTLAEAGLPGLEAALTLGLMAPKKTPPEVLAQLTEALNFALADPGYRDKRIEDGAVIPKSTSGEEFDRYLQADRKRWKEVISTLNLSLD